MSGPLDLLGGGPEQPTCSRAGCSSSAVWRVEWRNPRIHTDGRTKTWLACDAHVDYLRGFVEARGFPVAVTRFSDASGEPDPALESDAADEAPSTPDPTPASPLDRGAADGAARTGEEGAG